MRETPEFYPPENCLFLELQTFVECFYSFFGLGFHKMMLKLRFTYFHARIQSFFRLNHCFKALLNNQTKIDFSLLTKYL